MQIVHLVVQVVQMVQMVLQMAVMVLELVVEVQCIWASVHLVGIVRTAGTAADTAAADNNKVLLFAPVYSPAAAVPLAALSATRVVCYTVSPTQSFWHAYQPEHALSLLSH